MPFDCRCGRREAATSHSARTWWRSQRTARGNHCRAEREVQQAARAASDLFAFKANFRGAAIAADLLPVLSFAGGYGGMVVADDGLATLACCVRARSPAGAAWRSVRERDAGAVVEAMLRRECSGVGAALGGAERVGTVDRERAAPARRPSRPGSDGVFRVGDAAGEAHPIVGEGVEHGVAIGVRARRPDRPGSQRPGRRREHWAGAAARDCRLRSPLAAPVRTAPGRRRGLRPGRNAAGPGTRGVAAAAALAGSPDRRRALERQDPMRPEAARWAGAA